MDGFFNAMSASLVLLMLMSVGYFMGARGWMNASEKKFISKYIVNIAVPCNCLTGLLNNLDHDSLLEAGVMVVAAMLGVLMTLLLSLALAALLRLPRERWGVFVAMTAFSNTLFIGLPVSTQLFGDACIPYVMLYYLANTVFVQSVGFLLIERAGTQGRGSVTLSSFLKGVFSKPPILTVLFSLVLLALDVGLPSPVMKWAGYISGSVSPLALIYCGYIIYELGLKNLRLIRGLPTMIVVRLGVAPVVCWLFCRLFGMSGLTTGVLLAVVVGIVVLGGVQRIGRVTSYMVPFMAIFYIGAGLAVILLRIDQVPAALASIFTSAFSFEAVGGGVFGYAIMVAMRQGFARGVFSNEAGLGSAPMAHAASETQEPVEQGMWGVFEVFIDTIVICTLTSLAVILSGVLDVGLDSYATNGAAAVAAFNAILPGTIGGTIIQISLLFFALSTILGWSYYGERCWAYLSNNNKAVVWIFKVVFVLVCIVGATGNGTLMWDISDTLNGMMAIPNLIGLLLLSNVIIRSTNDYFKKH